MDSSARLLGEVEVAEEASVWPLAVLRADSEAIRVGRRAAVLDLALVEAPEGLPVEIGEEAIVSHGAKIHGAVIEPRSLVGIGAIVLDGAVVSRGCIIGAGALVPPRSVIPPDSLVLGVPGRVVRNTTEEERAGIMAQVEELLRKSRIYASLSAQKGDRGEMGTPSSRRF